MKKRKFTEVQLAKQGGSDRDHCSDTHRAPTDDDCSDRDSVNVDADPGASVDDTIAVCEMDVSME